MVKSSKVFLFPVVGIILAIFLLSVFFTAGQNVVQTFPVASMSALNNLRPPDPDYLWKLNTRRVALDRNKIYSQADYDEHLLQIFPGLWDVYGLLGYCYHYLNDDPKAIKYLKIAILNYPNYFWNYYNLAAIYINESRYSEASSVLQKALTVPPVVSLKKIFSSGYVYLPLLPPGQAQAFAYTAGHLKGMYQSSAELIQLLNQTGQNQKLQAALKKIDMELYAF